VIIALFFGFKVVAILAASIYLFGFLSIKGTGDGSLFLNSQLKLNK
jgi:hypothetical protein